METKDFTTSILVESDPKLVFNAVSNVRGWWSEEIDGNTVNLNTEFNYQYEDVHLCRIKIIESVPGQKIVWLVEENYFKFTKDPAEWTGTKIIFEISANGNKTELRFTHQGLTPAYECYNICQNAWGTYINKSLFNLITTGKGQPNAKGKPQTEDEKNLTPGNK